MKSLLHRFAIVLVFILSIQRASAQNDIVKCEHSYYTSWFSTSEHIPLMVNYTLTQSMVQCDRPIKRRNKFTADPEHYDITNLGKDYRKSGYDRGHNMPAADNHCDGQGMTECFYFCNMTPQPHSFNAGRWEDLEKMERKEAEEYDTVIVTVGSLGKAGEIGVDDVIVPQYMWKVIYIPSLARYECFYFPDADNVVEPLSDYEITLAHLKALSNITFNKGLPVLKQR